MTAATTTTTPGDIVLARPWVAGRETAPRKAVVCSIDGDYLVVWFRSMGALTSEESGHAIQAILPGKATVSGHVAALLVAVQRRLAKAALAYGSGSVAPLYQVLCSTIRALAA